MKRQNALLTICLFCLAILISACGGGGKATPPSYPFIPPQPEPVPEIHEMILSQNIFEINIRQTDNITVTLDNEDVTENAVYTPDDEGIATVEKGVITAHNQGSTIVNVHVEGADEDKTFTVNVIDPSLPTLELSKTQFNLGIGNTDNVTVTLEGKDVTEEVNYTTENENITTVDKGNIQAQYQGGETTVTVSLEGANNATFNVKVTDDSNEKVPLDDERLNKLFDLNLVDKNSENKTELTEINIPGAYKDNGKKYKIISISDSMFKNCTSLKTVTMQNSIETIGQEAFGGCSSLKEITIPNSVETIEKWGFGGCIALESLDIPNGVETIGQEAFASCSSLKEINIPDSVTSLGDEPFGWCTSLEKITLGNGLTEIKSVQFASLSALKEVTIGNGITSIGQNAFGGCSSLEKITLGNSVETIGNYAFAGCTSLKEITIPDSVTSLGDAPFGGCSSLEKITTGNGLTEIKNGQFSNLSALKEVTIGDGVTSIGNGAFASRTKLTTVNFGKNSSLTSIGDGAFANCTSLELTIPDRVETIGSDAFYNVKCIYYTNNLQADKTNAPWGAKSYQIIEN